MTQADSVLSTPPTNTPIGNTRRNFIAQVVAVSAAGGALGMTLPLPAAPAEPGKIEAVRDPIFAAIEAHRRANAAHETALALQACFERRYGASAISWDITTNPCADECDKFDALIATAAVTESGLLAWVAYLQELDGWMFTDREAAIALKSFAASLQNVRGLA